MDRYRKEVLQVSTRKHGINVQYFYDNRASISVILCFLDLGTEISHIGQAERYLGEGCKGNGEILNNCQSRTKISHLSNPHPSSGFLTG